MSPQNLPPQTGPGRAAPQPTRLIPACRFRLQPAGSSRRAISRHSRRGEGMAKERDGGDQAAVPANWQYWQRWVEDVDWSDWRSWLQRVASTDWSSGPWPG